MVGLKVRVEGPALDCQSLKAFLQSMDLVQLAEASPDVVLLAGPDWEQRARALLDQGNDCARGGKSPGMALLVRGGLPEMRRARTLGIGAYISPGSEVPQVYECLKSAAEGKPFCCPVLIDAIVAATPSFVMDEPSGKSEWRAASLSTQELRVALRAARGLTYRAIGKGLSIREATVKTHLQHVYAKLGVIKKAELREWLPCLVEVEQERCQASTPEPTGSATVAP